MMPGFAHERAVQQQHLRFAVLPGFGVELLHGLPDFERRRRRRQRFAEADGDRVGEVARHFPEEATFLERKDAAPNVVETDWDDRRVHIFHDALETATER